MSRVKWVIPAEKLEEIQHNISIIVGKVGPIFLFGHYELDDLETEALIWVNSKYHLYDGERSLFNFMYTIIKNRLYNLKRNKFSRLSPPCTKCPLNAYCKDTNSCLAYGDLEDCKYYAKWLKINKSKELLASVFNSGDIGVSSEEENILSKIANREELFNIWKQLPEHIQKIFEQVLQNERINRVKMSQLIEACKKVTTNKNATGS